jgi:hypothetical protein
MELTLQPAGIAVEFVTIIPAFGRAVSGLPDGQAEDRQTYKQSDIQRQGGLEFSNDGWHLLEKVGYLDCFESGGPCHLVADHMADESA